MTYAGIQMFMEKLKQHINCNDNESINNPAIIRERLQFQLLHEELASVIQTVLIDDHKDLHEINNLKERCIHAAEEAEYIVDLFISGVQNNRNFSASEEDIKPSLNLDDVRSSLESFKMEFLRMRIDKMDSSETLNHSAAARSNSPGSKKKPVEIIVGIDDDVKLIKDRLFENENNLDVISVVGMGGIGKTTLATKVFNDGYVKHHFHVRVWVTVSQTYDKRQVLIQILESIRDQLDLEKADDSQLREMVNKHLMSKRYLIVIDDIWHKETWDKLRVFFLHDNNGNRILLTSRFTEVAKHANSNGFIHHLGYMNKERSWELLCKKVFQDNEVVPEWCIKPGTQIVESCQGLPLAVLVIAGILAKEAWSEKLWVEIADGTSSYIVDDQNGCLETLGLSYKHLPFHLRDCFVYLGGFPEDHKFHVQMLISLWVAEGFVQQDGNRNLEDIAKGYVMDLIDRNLVIVSNRRKSSGDVKVFILQDLIRELCLRKANDKGLFLKIERISMPSQLSNVFTPPNKPVRMFITEDVNTLDSPHYPFSQNLRSILFVSYSNFLSEDTAKYFCSFVLLRVLDLQKCGLKDFPKGMELLVHLRYLAVWKPTRGFPSSICKLRGLQTLIYITRQNVTVLPKNISDLVNLRHLWNYLPSRGIRTFKMPFLLPSIEKPMNLQTI